MEPLSNSPRRSPHPVSRGQPQEKEVHVEIGGGGRLTAAVEGRPPVGQVEDLRVTLGGEPEQGGRLDVSKSIVTVQYGQVRLGITGSPAALIAVAGIAGEVACVGFVHTDPQIMPCGIVGVAAIALIALCGLWVRQPVDLKQKVKLEGGRAARRKR
jgi:hypothetical protein